MLNKALVIVPTYNERENIEHLIAQILEQGEEFDVLVVDDNSPDGTGLLVDQLIASLKGRVKVLHRSGKLGLGTAYLDGFRYGLENNYDFLFEMDADFSHDPVYLPVLLKAARHAGLAIGSRLVPGGKVVNWPWYRKLISRGGSLYSRTVLGLQVRDCTSGFKCFSRPILERLVLTNKIGSAGFGFQVEVNCVCEWNGYRITEVPIVFPDRILGKSKMSRKIFFEALFMVWKLRASKPHYLFSLALPGEGWVALSNDHSSLQVENKVNVMKEPTLA